MPEQEMTIKEIVDSSRASILATAKTVIAAKKNSFFKSEQATADQHGEMLANLTLAYRHLEDARMRIGKVLQAQDGGTSIYDR